MEQMTLFGSDRAMTPLASRVRRTLWKNLRVRSISWAKGKFCVS